MCPRIRVTTLGGRERGREKKGEHNTLNVMGTDNTERDGNTHKRMFGAHLWGMGYDPIGAHAHEGTAPLTPATRSAAPVSVLYTCHRSRKLCTSPPTLQRATYVPHGTTRYLVLHRTAPEAIFHAQRVLVRTACPGACSGTQQRLIRYK